MDQQTALIREAVRYTVSIYNLAVDRQAYPDLRAVFAEDGEMIINDDIRIAGRENIVQTLMAGARSRGAFEPGNFQRHTLGNSMIKVVDSKHARSVHFIQVITELGLDHGGLYIDDFVEDGGRWWIKTRRANLEWGRPDSRFFKYPGKAFITPREHLELGFVEG